ncbi:molybdopterin-dependent oxidoreductase [Streptacidiphilus anmyonensis]|uniref:molybdopterin-dependent oxidoreductase n=1 Tax=Streptacidiphilus anmyonensis TaxID=405782 RepID=UPI0005AAA815|nr:molybdopterin-dependent oxidoreductase [Streptacidiphilus anmyonensis]
MSVTPGFRGRRGFDLGRLPPGQYPTEDFPVLSAGPTPQIDTADWRLTVTTETGERSVLTWPRLMALPQHDITADLHCVTRWSKFDTHWRGVAVEDVIDRVGTAADFVIAHSYGGYSTNLPLEDVLDGRAWIVHTFDGFALSPEHGGPARLLVPHLYLWKSAKWINGLTLSDVDEPGFWESAGYHNHGDPWREQREWKD